MCTGHVRLFTFIGTAAYQCSLCNLPHQEIYKIHLVDCLYNSPEEESHQGPFQCSQPHPCTQQSVLVLYVKKMMIT